MLSFQTTNRAQRAIIHTYESLAFLMNSKKKTKKKVSVKTMTIKKTGSDYWLSIVYEITPRDTQAGEFKHLKPCKPGKLGIDLGVVKSVCTYEQDANGNRFFNRLLV